MSWSGVILGAMSFLIIGVWHPIVIKGEYYLGKRICMPLFFVIGLGSVAVSLWVENLYVSVGLALFGFSAWWGMKETIEQEKRVAKGWFPKNPKRKD